MTRAGLNITDVGTPTLTVRAQDFDTLSEDVHEDGLHRPTQLEYTITVENADITRVLRTRRAEVNETYVWETVEDNTELPPADLPDAVRDRVETQL